MNRIQVALTFIKDVEIRQNKRVEPLEETPAALAPAMARPVMSAVLLGATALINLPSSKMNSGTRNVDLIGKYLNVLPHVD